MTGEAIRTSLSLRTMEELRDLASQRGVAGAARGPRSYTVSPARSRSAPPRSAL